MKKIIFYIFIFFTLSLSLNAQNQDNFLSDFASVDKAQYQLIDKETLKNSIEIAKAADTSGKLAAQMPAFMDKLEYIEILDLSNSALEERTKFKSRYDELNKENKYQTLVDVTENNQNVKVVAKKENEIVSEIIIFAFDNDRDGITVVKMAGNLDDADIADILKQQNISPDEVSE